MLKWIKNSKSNYQSKTNYKGIQLDVNGDYIAKVTVRIANGHNKPKQVKHIVLGTFKTLKEAKEKRVKYILSQL